MKEMYTIQKIYIFLHLTLKLSVGLSKLGSKQADASFGFEFAAQKNFHLSMIKAQYKFRDDRTCLLPCVSSSSLYMDMVTEMDSSYNRRYPLEGIFPPNQKYITF